MQIPKTESKGILQAVKGLLIESVRVSYVLFRIMVPVIIVVKILSELGAVKYIAAGLSPLMDIVGLPGAMGIVWATTLLTNLYGGIVVLAALFGENPLTAAQATILASMMLIAHSLPIELRIAQAAGARLPVMGLIRFGAAVLYGWLLKLLYSTTGTLQQKAVFMWKQQAPQASLPAWAYGELVNLAMIFVIVLALLALMKVLRRLGVTALMERLLHPVLTPLGIDHSATDITIIGMTLGISFGGGLIIREARSGRIGGKDVFFAMALMGLSHSLIEDTTVMVLIGGHLSGILFLRLLFSVAFVFVLVRIVNALPQTVFARFFYNRGISKPNGDEAVAS